jgi:hypothetical protein
MSRQVMRDHSNNPKNPNKNACALAVANALGVGDVTRYLHTLEDLRRAIRSMYSLRSVKTAVKATPYTTLGSIRKNLQEHNKSADACMAYVAHVRDHVLLLSNEGKTLIDTAPVKRDRRKVLNIYGVYIPLDDRTKMRKINGEFYRGKKTDVC